MTIEAAVPTRRHRSRTPRGSLPRWTAGMTGLLVATTTACTSSSPSSPASASGGAGVEVGPPTAEELAPTLMGWSNAAVPGEQPEVLGTWMARESWENLALGQWLTDNPDYTDHVAQYPGGAADIGVPLVPHESGQDLNGLLEEAASGERDDVYRSMGAALAESGPATVYARVWWEMNLQPMADGLDPALFRAAWEHAVPLVREGFAAGADDGQTLQVVFSPNADGADYRPFYPDDADVDLMALDAYGQQWGTDTPDAASLLRLVDDQLTAFTEFARSHGKPVALAEWANVADKPAGGADQMQGRGDFPPYVSLVLDWAAREDAVYLLYFNAADAGVGQTLDDTPESLAVLRGAWS